MLQKRNHKQAVVWCPHCQQGVSYPLQELPLPCPWCQKPIEVLLYIRPKQDPRRAFETDDRQQGPL